MKSTLFSSTVSPLLCRLVAVSALGLTGVFAVGCGSTVDPSETAAGPAAAAQAATAPAAAIHAEPGGPFFHALSAVTLRPDQQKTVDGLRATLATQAAPVRAARAALNAEVADEVRSGAMDETRLRSLFQNVKTAVEANRPAMQLAVQQLHDTLDATQRQALVAALPARGDHEAHAPGGHRAEMKARMDKIAAELNLTEAQRTAIHDGMRAKFAEHKDAMKDAVRGDHEQMKARMGAITTAFASDTFDAKGLGLGEHAGAMMGHFARMHGAFLEVAVPVLTPAQRAILATKIQSHMEAAEGATVNEPAEGADAVEE